MSALMDDPNRECVGLDPAWVEGTGGGEPAAADGGPLDGLTKAGLLEHAAARGVDVNESMTKAEIIAALEAGQP